MNKKLQILVLILFTLIGCVSKSDYEKLQQEIDQLKDEVTRLTNENHELQEYKRKNEEEKRVYSMYSETDALRFIKDYYEFYKADKKYRKPKVRRVSENVFQVSLQECTNKREFLSHEFFWESMVLKLTIYEDGKYDVVRDTY